MAETLAKSWGVSHLKPEPKPESLLWDKQYNVNKDSLITGEPTFQKVCCYTDGSKFQQKVGWGFHINITNDLNDKEIIEDCGRLNDESSVFQAEIMAIIKATMAIEKLTTKVEWHFYCDNQGAVKTLDNPEVNTKLVWDCSKALSELGTRSKVTLHWVKAHVGHPGNERADTLAKKGTTLTELETIPVPRSYLNLILNETLESKWNQRWNCSKDYRQTKLWFPEIQVHRSENLMKLNRIEFGKAVQTISGHAYLRYHQHKWDPSIPEQCRFCEFPREDAQHIVQDCPYFSKARENATGYTCMVPVSLATLPKMINESYGKLLEIESIHLTNLS